MQLANTRKETGQKVEDATKVYNNVSADSNFMKCQCQ
jgi:hypothetical protein